MTEWSWPTWLRRSAVAMSTIVVLVLLGAAGVVWSIDRSLHRTDVGGLDTGLTSAAAADEDEDVDGLTVLVLGSDSRAVLTPEERRELGTGDVPGERTESISIVRLDPERGEVRVLAIPRDSLVTRCDGSRGRINAAYAIGERDTLGGETCVVETIRSLLGVPIDHVVKVDFRGFLDIVDSVGGVPIYLERPLQDRRSRLDVAAGCVRLDGPRALAFVRARGMDDDFGRIGRQQQFIRSLRARVAGMTGMGNVPRLLGLARSTARALELDSGLSMTRIQNLVRAHRWALLTEMETRVIPGETYMDGGNAFLRIAEDEARELARWVLAGDRTPVATDGAESSPGTDPTPGGSSGEATGSEGRPTPSVPSSQADTTPTPSPDHAALERACLGD